MPHSKSVLIIGAGPGGILMAIRLLEQGVTDLTVFEKADSVGGTWRDNRYPGVACDVPAHYYSYSFAPNADARTTFATGAELEAYFTHIARDHGVLEHVRFGTEAVDARWTGTDWRVTTDDGTVQHFDVVITAVGRLHRPRIPEIAGMDDFAGVITHSSRWDPATDLTGTRVGVIGTGSSAVQITSAASKVAAHLDLYQRTAQWVMPMANEQIPESVRQEMATPEGAERHYREVEQQLIELGDTILRSDSEGTRKRNAGVRAAVAAVQDPVLRAKLTPDYEVGCKRLIISGTFYEAVQRPNVSVVTDGIERIEAGGIRTKDGAFRPLDVIILATGFHADSYMRPMTVTGEDGVDLDRLWADAFLNYKSVALPSMPNLFTVNGPFSPGGSLSILAVIEAHTAYIAKLVARIVADDVAIEPEQERAEALLDEVRDRAKQTVWFTGGCQSWYLDRNGVPIVAPLTLKQLHDDLEDVVWSDYSVEPLLAGAGR